MVQTQCLLWFGWNTFPWPVRINNENAIDFHSVHVNVVVLLYCFATAAVCAQIATHWTTLHSAAVEKTCVGMVHCPMLLRWFIHNSKMLQLIRLQRRRYTEQILDDLSSWILLLLNKNYSLIVSFFYYLLIGVQQQWRTTTSDPRSSPFQINCSSCRVPELNDWVQLGGSGGSGVTFD